MNSHESSKRPNERLKRVVKRCPAVMRGLFFVLAISSLCATRGLADSGEEGWELYFDGRFSFSVEYPASWTYEIADENGDAFPDYVMKRSIYYKSGGPATFMIYVWSNREGLDLVSWLNANYKDLMSYPEELPSEVGETILGHPAVRFTNRQMTTCNLENILFQHKEWLYLFQYRNCDASASAPLFQHLVESFVGEP